MIARNGASTKVVGHHVGSSCDSVLVRESPCREKRKELENTLTNFHGSGAGPALTLSELPGRAEILSVAFFQVKLGKPRESSTCVLVERLV